MNFQQSPFPKKWRQISKIVQIVKLRAKHTSFYMDHKAIQYSACSVHFATANFHPFPVWMQTIKTSIRRYSGKKKKKKKKKRKEKKTFRVGWLYYCFTALRYILSHFERGQLAYPHCSWASLIGSLAVLSAYSFASNWQMPFLNQRNGDNGRRIFFMTKFPRKNVSGVRIEPATICLPGGTRIRPSLRTRLIIPGNGIKSLHWHYLQYHFGPDQIFIGPRSELW